MTPTSRNPRIRIASSDREFSARPGETVLAAALRQGIVLPYSCKNGTCASCKCRLIEGRIEYPYNPPAALEADDYSEGNALSCQAVPAGNLVIQAQEIKQVADIPVRLLPARVESLERFTSEIMRLRLKLPQAARLQFLAGQYIDILQPGGKRRAFSIASPPSETEFIELHIKYVEGGGFTGHVFTGMTLKEIVRLEGPLGTFFMRRSSDRPVIMVGGGTGFAPLKSMIEELIEAGDSRPVELYWGARRESDLYARELIRQWEGSRPDFRFVPVLSEPDDDWQGARGFVHEVVLQHHPDLSSFDLYMSGPPAMIHAARPAFLDAGAPEDRLFFDSFDFGPDVPPSAA